MPYGKGRVAERHSTLYDEIVTIDEFVPWRDGTRSVWVTTEGGYQLSFREDEIELTEVY